MEGEDTWPFLGKKIFLTPILLKISQNTLEIISENRDKKISKKIFEIFRT